jgi:hypothetical protein
MYDTLTEHAHPNQGAFSQYYRWDRSPTGARVVLLSGRPQSLDRIETMRDDLRLVEC